MPLGFAGQYPRIAWFIWGLGIVGEMTRQRDIIGILDRLSEGKRSLYDQAVERVWQVRVA
jgi:hypothetical protein